MSESQPSSARQPDLDWSQIRETVTMLNLAVARIENAMLEGNESVNNLTASFTHMARHVQGIESELGSLADSPGKASIAQHCQAVSSQVQSAIMAFQFYDRLSQRLQHVSKSLASLTEVVSDPARLYNPQQWQQLQETILASYTLDDDRQLFEAIINGQSLQAVLAQAARQEQREDDVELF